MKIMILTAIVLVAAMTSRAQYFRRQGAVVQLPQNDTADYLFPKYLQRAWVPKVDTFQTAIESPIVIKKLPSYHYSTEPRFSQIETSSFEKAKRYHNKRSWQDMNLRPLIDLAYSLYNPQYIQRAH